MKESRTQDYESPVTSVVKLYFAPYCASGSNVETMTPEDWSEGNTDWWNS